jgi:sodium-dependent dicarboxylate transporter 2/3/5
MAVYLVLPVDYTSAAGEAVLLEYSARSTAALAIWMAVWWMTEAIPIYATALLPLAYLPLTGAATVKAAAAPFAHELIFLFLGGFIIALCMERWNLHRRVALLTLKVVGEDPRRIVGGFMLATALLSMWVSNTATVVMMLPIAASVIRLVDSDEAISDTRDRRNFALSLLLGIAYAASIGGLGTLVGTPPNLFLASFAQDELGHSISFVGWMGIALPLVVVFAPLTWFLLTRVIYPVSLRQIPGAAAAADESYQELGAFSRGEKTILVVFLLTATCWTLRPLLTQIQIGSVKPLAGLSDSVIAIVAALSLFVIPVNSREAVYAMDWRSTARLPWGVLILLGGGLSLAAAIRDTGVGEFLGAQMAGFSSLPGLVLVAIVVTGVVFLTELTSNTATTATLVPILASLAPAVGVHPFALIVPATIAASCAFMLPVATPPNAIVFGTGHLSVPDMSTAGIWLNLIGIVLIILLTYLVALPMLGVTV